MLSKKTKDALRKRTFTKITALLLINGVIANVVIREIVQAKPEEALLVKNSEVLAQDARLIEGQVENAPIDEKATVTVYKVKNGDTISAIAEKFHVSVNTIRWANDLDTKAQIKPGDSLTILPVTGIQYKVKSGDTISAIANRFSADSSEISKFNELEDGKLKVGETIIIPDAEPIVTSTKPARIEAKKTVAITQKSTETKIAAKTDDTKDEATKSDTSKKTKSTGYYTHPIPGAVLTQGMHGYNGVDFGAPIGTSVKAAASGKVIVVKGGSAWNGGYGNYIVIEHDNGTQTLYAHLNKIGVSIGDTVSKGEEIAKSGNTGRSTGPHLHFEVKGASNPWVKIKVGTKF
jgi:murein DD-endopeptidase MepM/ murein hydrolase activator NlpD